MSATAVRWVVPSRGVPTCARRRSLCERVRSSRVARSAPERAEVTASSPADENLEKLEESDEPEPAIFVGCVTLLDDALVACAALRVQCFYRYDHETRDPSGALLFGEASENARRVWQKRHLEAEVNRGRRLSDLGMRVSSFAATTRAPCDETISYELELLTATERSEAARWDLNAPIGGEVSSLDSNDRSKSKKFDSEKKYSDVPVRCLIPKSTHSLSNEPQKEVVGTVDLHVGARLPGEFLEGSLPRRAGGGTEDDRDEGLTVKIIGKAQPCGEEMNPESIDAGTNTGTVDVAVAAVAAFAQVATVDDSVVASSSSLFHHGNAALPLTPPVDGGEGYAGGGALDGKRAYAFNVCVAVHRRRHGVAKRLLNAAHQSAKDKGVLYVYCHVEKDNEKARNLYESVGYVPEKEESDWLAGKLGRPPRVLMRKKI